MVSTSLPPCRPDSRSRCASRTLLPGFEPVPRRIEHPHDRRASRLALTPTGRTALTAATATYEKCLADLLDPTLTPTEQTQMHALVTRLLSAATKAQPLTQPTMPQNRA